MPNKWIQHTKDYAKKNNMSYRDAIKDSKCKSSYQRKIKKGKGFKETFQKLGKHVNNVGQKKINIINSALFQKWGLNHEFENNLQKYGNDNIVKLEVIRIPLSKALNNVLNLITLGKVDREKVKQNVDHLYHLKLELILDNGTKLSLEKDGVSKLSTTNLRNDSQQPMLVHLNHPIKLETFIKNTIDLMNQHNYTHYNSVTNNCQHFVTSHLKANHLLTPELNSFINQDLVDNLFNKSEQKAIKTVTDLAGTASTIQDNIIHLV